MRYGLLATTPPLPEIVVYVTLTSSKQIVKLFDETAAQVKANEPGTLQYYAVRPKKGDELHIVER